MTIRKPIYIVLVILFMGCGSKESNAQHAQNTELNAAQQKWLNANIHDYRFTFQRICFCPVESDIVVTVKGDMINTASYKDTGLPVTEERMQSVPTINGLFDIIEKAYLQKAERVRVTYNSTYGYPETASIDYFRNVIDEEITYRIIDFTR